eukprot:TRINITY_DN8237_c1_g1_i1.p1 TRINITY_DN8237_c1_g1~~TRINITY_DN8237_c1_g1_i1.p1  ORF type:complete len:684 (-),score=179.77 TRINITY_DN8237_c1_g1_i1:56-2107(-)
MQAVLRSPLFVDAGFHSRGAADSDEPAIVAWFCAAKVARSVSLLIGYLMLASLGVSVVWFQFLVLAGVSIALLLHAPMGKKVAPTPAQWAMLAVSGALLLARSLLLAVGLKHCGVLRAVLAEYADMPVLAVLVLALDQRERELLSLGQLAGACGVVLGYALVLFVPEPAPQFNLGLAALFLSVIVSLVQSAMSTRSRSLRQLGAQRLVSLTPPFAAIACVPLLFFTSGPFVQPDVLPQVPVYAKHAIALLCAAVVASFTVFEITIELTSRKQFSPCALMKTTIVSSFATAAILELFVMRRPPALCCAAGAASAFFGVRHAAPNAPHSASTPLAESPLLPVYSVGGPNRAVVLRLPLSKIVRTTIKQTLDNKKSRRLFLYLMVNLAFMFVEVLWGIWTNSLGLISDGCHMLFDCLALAIGLCAAVISQWDPNNVFSYGFARVQVLSGFVNAVLLVFIAGFVLLESLHRFVEAAEMKTERLMLVSVVGLVVNLLGVLAFHDHGDEEGGCHGGGACSHSHGHGHGHHAGKQYYQYDKQKSSDDNMHSIFLHVLADTVGSIGVIVSSTLIELWGVHLADPICSLCISVLIFTSVAPLLRHSASVLLQCTPGVLDNEVEPVLHKLCCIEGVYGVHDVHIWCYAGPSSNVCTMVVEVSSTTNEQRVLNQATVLLRELGITNTTVEIHKN